MSIIKEYPHIKRIVSEPDKGIYDAMNKGIKLSRGSIISILNSDDCYYRNALKIAVKYFKKYQTFDPK